MANTYNTLIVFFILFASFFNNWVCVTTFSRRAERLNYCAYKYVYDHKIILLKILLSSVIIVAGTAGEVSLPFGFRSALEHTVDCTDDCCDAC
jgi:hypothetical protein